MRNQKSPADFEPQAGEGWRTVAVWVAVSGLLVVLAMVSLFQTP